MICPRCGSTITMSEYKCSGCALDLHCNTPEGRQKAEQYANQMYASGKWKVRQTVQSITDIPKPEEKPKVVYEKPKRNPFKIATIILSLATLVTTFLFLVMLGAARDLSDEKAGLIAELERLRQSPQAEESTDESEPSLLWSETYDGDGQEIKAELFLQDDISKLFKINHVVASEDFENIDLYSCAVYLSFLNHFEIMQNEGIKDWTFHAYYADGQRYLYVSFKDGTETTSFGQNTDGSESNGMPDWFNAAGEKEVYGEYPELIPWLLETYESIKTVL